MRQIEYTQRLSYHLIDNVVVAAVEARTVQVHQVHFAGCFKPIILVIAAQREQFVVLISDIGIDVELHVPRGKRGGSQRKFDTAVAHRAQIVKQLVVAERRNAHIIQIQHVGCLGRVEIQRSDDAVTQKSGANTRIETAFYLPFEVGVGIAQLIE